MIRYDPQDGSPQYLEDLATGYWFAQVLFTAVEMEIFTLLAPAGAGAEEAAGAMGVDRRALERFLRTLCALGLAGRSGRPSNLLDFAEHLRSDNSWLKKGNFQHGAPASIDNFPVSKLWAL